MKMYDGVLQRVRAIENKNLIFYATENGVLYKVLKWIYIVSTAYFLFNSTAYILGTSMIMSGKMTPEIKNVLITVITCTVAILVCFVLILKHIHIAPASVTVVSVAISVGIFSVLLRDELTLHGYHPKFYWRHLAPGALTLITVIWMTVIAVRARRKTKKMYDKVVGDLYELYHVTEENAENLTAEQWDDFLKNFDPNDYRRQFKKINSKDENGE